MAFKSIIGATNACLAVVFFNAHTVLISADLGADGDNLIPRSTETGIDE